MEPHFSRRYLWFKTAKEVRDAARRMYSDLGNASQVFEIRSKLKEIKQGSNSVTQYFSDLQDLWQELDLFLEDMKTCAECSVKLWLNLEKERVFDFLVGLNRDLDDIRGRLVARDPFPSPDDAFAEVRVRNFDAKLYSLMCHNLSLLLILLSWFCTKILLKVSTKSNGLGATTVIGRPYKGQMLGNSRQTSKLAAPKTFDGCGLHTLSAQEQPANSNISVPFSKEQIDQIEEYCCLLRQTSFSPSSSTTVGSCSIIQSGKNHIVLSSFLNTSWIVDSGASDHMTRDPR